MSSIVEFLTARYDEAEAAWHRERLVRPMSGEPCPECGWFITEYTVFPRDGWYEIGHEGRLSYCYVAETKWRELTDLGPAGDPAVLADLASKRAILQDCVDVIGGEPDNAWYDGASPVGVCNDVLAHLAQPFADHPDYDPAWAVEVHA